ncbi:helix-turn-helix domain-containing protein [Streptomyces sp. NPDC002746]
MPARRFDGPRLKVIRRAANMSQLDLAKGVLGHTSHVSLAKWEAGKAFPPPEHLPKLAKALDRDLDELFPRDGEPDLIDLRADAGYSQTRAADSSGVHRAQLGLAERGVKELTDAQAEALATLYGTPVEELLVAQRRSFGEYVPVAPPAPATPQPLAATITLLIERRYGTQLQIPPCEEIAAAVNETVGSPVITGPQLTALRNGVAASSVFTGPARAIAFEALSAYFEVPVMTFEDDRSRKRRVMEDISYLADLSNIALSARNGERGVSAAMLDVLNQLVADELQSEHADRPPR